MDFKEFLNTGWADHAKDPSAVAARLPQGFALITSVDEITGLAGLIAHVFGEHLGEWGQGLALLHKLRDVPVFLVGTEADKTIARSIAAFELAKGGKPSLAAFSISDQIRTLALAAASLNGCGRSGEARLFFTAALEQAEGLPKDDPANRSLAMTGNNMASALEEKSSRTANETKFMISSAQAARKFWEIAGGWLQVERAEYRLAQTFLKASDAVQASVHAQRCLDIVLENGSPAVELFFAYEVMVLAAKASGSENLLTLIDKAHKAFASLSPDEQTSFRPALVRIESLVS